MSKPISTFCWDDARSMPKEESREAAAHRLRAFRRMRKNGWTLVRLRPGVYRARKHDVAAIIRTR